MRPLRVVIASSTRPAASRSEGESAAWADAVHESIPKRKHFTIDFIVYGTTFTGLPSRRGRRGDIELRATTSLSLNPSLTSILVRLDAATVTARRCNLSFTIWYT